MPNGYVRHLLLGFTPDNAATDGVDYGYDARNIENFPDDLNWMIENERYIIQGVGAFDNTKQYPLGMFITNAGDITIALDTLENFETEIEVFLYDALNNTYTFLNNMDYLENVNPGSHLDRYFIAFGNNTNGIIIDNTNESLSINENILQDITISYLRQSQEILVLSNQNITKMEVFNLMGKQILEFNNINKNELRLPLQFTKENYGIVRVYTHKGTTNKKLALR
jgi:hypothetical protein